MWPTDAECAARYRIQPALRERRRSVSTIHQAVRCRSPSLRLLWLTARLQQSRASRALSEAVQEQAFGVVVEPACQLHACRTKATSIIGCRHDGQGTPLCPSPRMACSHNGLIDSGVKRLRNSWIVAARPPQLSHAQKTPPEVRTSFNGSSQRGQMSAVSAVIGHGLHSQ
jgi:hypothetical protein